MAIRSKGVVNRLKLAADPADDQKDQERDHDTDDTPETPPDEPRPPRIEDPPPQPDQKGPYVVRSCAQ
jgi:hypothetical protein